MKKLIPITVKAKDGAQFSLTPYAAHLTSWVPAGGSEQLFLSKAAQFKDGAAIRGGVPIIFPQFHSLGSLPRHGFARTSEWRVVAAGQRADGAAHAVLELTENIARLTIWPFVFTAELRITALGNTLQIALHITNTGDTTFTFTGALHTYFAVRDITDAAVIGLQGTRYGDALLGKTACTETDAVLRIVDEIDRVYESTPASLTLQQPHQLTRISAAGFTDTVIWNPGKAGAAKMSDMEPGGEQKMLCIEAGVIARPVSLAPGQDWLGSQTMQVSWS